MHVAQHFVFVAALWGTSVVAYEMAVVDVVNRAGDRVEEVGISVNVDARCVQLAVGDMVFERAGDVR